MSKFSITLQSVLNFASTHADLLPLSNVGGYTNEPGISICNDALSDLIAEPNDWKDNRVEMPILFTCPNKLDQQFGGACIFTIGYQGSASNVPGWPSQGWGIALASNNGITVSSGTVTVTTLENHRIPVGATVYMTGNVATTGTTSAYNSVFTDNGTSSSWGTPLWTVLTITANTLTFAATSGQNNSDVAGAPGITNFAYATSASLQELNNTSSPPNQKPVTVYRELPVVSRVANPEGVSVLFDNGDGTLKIRYNFVPGSVVWGVRIVYQALPPLKVALTDNWSPFPDRYSALYRQAVLYRMYRYLNDPKADNEYKKLQAEMLKVQGGDMAEPSDIHVLPQESLMDGQDFWGWY